MNDSTIKRIIPFSIHLIIEATLKEMGTQQGYQYIAKAIGKIGNKRIPLRVRQEQGWCHIDHLHSLQFYVAVDANALVPLVNQKNRESPQEE